MHRSTQLSTQLASGTVGFINVDWEFAPCPGNPGIIVRAAAWEQGGYRRLRITCVLCLQPARQCVHVCNRGAQESVKTATLDGVPLTQESWCAGLHCTTTTAPHHRSGSSWVIYSAGPTCQTGCNLVLTSTSDKTVQGTLTVPDFYSETDSGGVTITLPQF